MDRKLKALKKPGIMWGFSQAHSDRFARNLLWKETLSFPYSVKSSRSMKYIIIITFGLFFCHRMDIKNSSSTTRCKYYPACDEPSLVLGTGHHSDPTSLAILYQDQLGGLEHVVEPCPDALVINVGDTFMSCLHRAVVNESMERKSMAFFMNPREDKVVNK
ncbi:hypothetical protein Cgig2_005960 [Carnegiea gigantea]|uniref:Fe2OG dioxygenase domain-containing protein n=1 Tax=Carnegiea gigantea TaxID=171969 RepID=A0A9Q1KKE9_9CARY|nr:hypothetical protein Cgig2_005960 [Carnegiea gigantea]